MNLLTHPSTIRLACFAGVLSLMAVWEILAPRRRPTTARLSPTQILLVGTDGFSDPLGDGDGLVGALFARHLTTPPPPVWLAHVLDFSRETFDDDRTLLAVWPRPDDD